MPSVDGASPFELFAGFDPPASLEESLTTISDRVRETFDVDVVLMRAEEEDRTRVARAFSTEDHAVRAAFSDAMTALRPETTGLGLNNLGGGAAVAWADLAGEPAVIARLAELEDMGFPMDTATRMLRGATAVAMPLRTPNNPNLGALGLIAFPGRRPLGDMEREALEALAPQISLAVQNALLRDRNRRTRQVLEAMIATTRNGVIVIDTSGIVSIVNRAYGDLLKVPTEKLLGQPAQRVLRELIIPRFTDPDAYERIATRLEARPNITVRDQLETVDGLVLERFSAPVRDPSGEHLGRVVILSDITVRHRALIEARTLAEANAELLQREEARAQEEIALARAAHMLASAFSRQDIHDQLVDQVDGLVAADRVALFLVRRRGDVVPVASRGFDDDSLTDLRQRRGEGMAGRVAESRRTLLCNDALIDPTLELVGPEIEHARSIIAVPIELVERAYGVLAVYSGEPHAFDERDLRVVSELARTAESAVQNALLFEHERRIAESLQDALLAEEPPEVPGLEMATLYRASGGAMVGGDVHDVWVMGPGRVAVMVGDVAGKGINAAGTTGMVRYILEGLAVHEHDPGRLFDHLSRLVSGRLGEAAFVTGFLGIVDTSADTLTWACAGHVPPLVLVAGRVQTTLDDPDPPLGFRHMDGPYRAHSTAFPVGSLLVLTTDGIIEARRDAEMFGEERLRDTIVRLSALPPHDIAQGIYAAARRFAGGPLQDDAALAVVRRIPAPDTPPAAS